jgi:hypothetical protein
MALHEFELYSYTISTPFQPITYLHPSSNNIPDLRIMVSKQRWDFLSIVKNFSLNYQSSFLDAHGIPRIRIWKNLSTSFIDVLGFFFILKDNVFYCFAPGKFEQIKFEEILFRTIFPIWLESKEIVCLHASSVSLDGMGKAIGFLANSGTGKSTMVAQLISQNSSFITDDILALQYNQNYYYSLPGYPEQKLRYDQKNLFPREWASRHDSISNKLRISIPPERCARVQTPLSALFILLPQKDSCKISINRLSPSAACIELIRYSYATPIVRNPDPHRLSRLTRLVNRIPVFELCYPYGINHILQIQSEILQVLTPTE